MIESIEEAGEDEEELIGMKYRIEDEDNVYVVSADTAAIVSVLCDISVRLRNIKDEIASSH